MTSFLGPGSGQTTAGVTEIWEYELQPTQLSRLRTGGPENRYCVDAILQKTRSEFRSTGRNWARVTFSQK
jgi:hypothetical protein